MSDNTEAKVNENDRIRSFIEGDKDALAWAMAEYGRLLYRLAYGFVGNSEDTDDILQEVWIRAYTKRRQLRSGENLKAWLCKITANTSLNAVRKKKKFWDFLRRKPADAKREDPNTAIDAQSARTFIEKLPKQQRAATILKIDRELTYEEIAKVLGCSVGAAKANVHFAMRNLRKMLKEEK